MVPNELVLGIFFVKQITDGDKTAILSIMAATVVALPFAGAAGPVAGGIAGITAILGRRKFPDAEQMLYDSLPEDAKLFLPTVTMAYGQLLRDLNNSPLSSPKLQSVEEELIKEENSLLNPAENMLPVESELKRLFLGRVWGEASESDLSLLRELVNSEEPLRIDCQSICVGAYATLASMKNKYDLNIEVDPSSASGREQSVTMSYDDDDFIITADAPMILGDSAFPFQKCFTVSREMQSLLCVRGGQHRDKRAVHIYPKSSVEHQVMLMSEKASNFDSSALSRAVEIEIDDLADYMHLEKIMKPGDYVFAWDPLRIKLRGLQMFEEVPGTEFELPISMFKRENPRYDEEYIEAFLRVFVSELNEVRKFPFSAWKLLISDKKFRDSLVRGAALKLNPLLTPE